MNYLIYVCTIALFCHHNFYLISIVFYFYLNRFYLTLTSNLFMVVTYYYSSLITFRLDKEAGGLDKRSQGAVPSVTDFDFRTFLSSASESALEEVLTAYTHKNKSASVFLGASKAKNTQRYNYGLYS